MDGGLTRTQRTLAFPRRSPQPSRILKFGIDFPLGSCTLRFRLLRCHAQALPGGIAHTACVARKGECSAKGEKAHAPEFPTEAAYEALLEGRHELDGDLVKIVAEGKTYFLKKADVDRIMESNKIDTIIEAFKHTDSKILPPDMLMSFINAITKYYREDPDLLENDFKVANSLLGLGDVKKTIVDETEPEIITSEENSETKKLEKKQKKKNKKILKSQKTKRRLRNKDLIAMKLMVAKESVKKSIKKHKPKERMFIQKIKRK